MREFKDWARPWVPRPIWVFFRRIWTYICRLVHWGYVLREARGDGMREAVKLYASAVAGPITSLTDLDRWSSPHLCFDVKILIGGRDRFLCRRRFDDLWHVLPAAQGALREIMAKHLRPGGTFVDAGANIGGITVYGAHLVGCDGATIAIEMMPKTASRLRAHLAENRLDWVRVVENALSDVPGLEITATVPRGVPGQASIALDQWNSDTLDTVPVTTTSLDIVTRDLPRIDVLKVDLEGAEAIAFADGTSTLSRTQCVIFED